MAKPATILIKLLSTAGTGYFNEAKNNPRKTTEKLEFRKYDPVVRKHVAFKEAKIKKAASPRAACNARLSAGVFVFVAPNKTSAVPARKQPC
jgi:large subunit ribosomal protein L33